MLLLVSVHATSSGTYGLLDATKKILGGAHAPSRRSELTV